MMNPMTDRDPAFLWETETLRSAVRRAPHPEAENGKHVVPDGDWVTLREASRSTGIPLETVRKWARRKTVPTYLVAGPGRTEVRMVDLVGVKQRATELGRTIAPEATTASTQFPPDVSQPVAAASAEPTSSTPAAQAPPGTMIVPVDAWNKMLNQLGNLHEAGQHLAEARERAAKAETEAKFLRERLSELRQETAATSPAPSTPPPAPPVADKTMDDRAGPPEKVWRYLVRRVRDRNMG